jgi:hypothetical protein
MKKLLGVLVVVLLAVPAFAAPTSQGNFVVTLPLFQYVTYNDDLYKAMYGDEETNMIIGAENYQMGVEWFVIDGLAIGGGISYNTWDEAETEVFTVMPTVTYYYAMDKLIPYIGAGFKYIDISDDPALVMAMDIPIFVNWVWRICWGTTLHCLVSSSIAMIHLMWNAGDEDGNTMSGSQAELKLSSKISY